MFDLTTYVKKWQIRQLKTVFSTLDTLWRRSDLRIGRALLDVGGRHCGGSRKVAERMQK